MRPLALVLQETRAGWWQLQGVCSGLLLLCVVASEVWDAETKPVEFVCHRGVRRSLNVAAATERALRSCNGSMTLSAPVQMPCVELHAASWQNQTHQEKRGDIVASLRLLSQSVKAARAAAPAACSAPVLLRLENNIHNYQLILTNLQLSGPAVTPALSCVPRDTPSVPTLLRSYHQLISGKLERLVLELRDRCP